MKELTVDAAIARLQDVQDCVRQVAEDQGFGERSQYAVALAVEEVFVNIVSYAYPDGEGAVTVRCLPDADGGITLEFEDSGIPYNPLARDDPDVSLPPEQRSIGGLGVFLIKKTMDSVSYRHQDGKNILTMRKQRTS